jgi:hypothetical protein
MRRLKGSADLLEDRKPLQRHSRLPIEHSTSYTPELNPGEGGRHHRLDRRNPNLTPETARLHRAIRTPFLFAPINCIIYAEINNVAVPRRFPNGDANPLVRKLGDPARLRFFWPYASDSNSIDRV